MAKIKYPFRSVGDEYKEIRLDDSQRTAVRDWILGCEVAWVPCETASAACDLEDRMKKEWMPPLTKQ